MNEAIRPGPESPPQGQQAALRSPELSVIVPTFNERDNVTVLYRRLEAGQWVVTDPVLKDPAHIYTPGAGG